MEEIQIETFRGIAPKHGKNLPVGFAETAQNCKLFDGKLAPLAKNTEAQAETHHYNSFAYHCGGWVYGNDRFFCPWKIGVLDLLIYMDDDNYLKKKVAWIITKTDISFDAASKEIRSANGDFNIDSLNEGATFVISNSANNDGTFTVSSTATTTTVITVDEAVVNEVAGATVTIKVCKEDYLGQTRQGLPTVVVGGEEIEELGSWAEVAGTYGSETKVYKLIVFNEKLYGGTEPNAKLLEWNETDKWIERATQLADVGGIHPLCEYDGKLYGGVYHNGELYEWNGTSAWVKKVDSMGSPSCAHTLCVHNDKLYMAGDDTIPDLYEWNDTDTFTSVAAVPGGEDCMRALRVFDDVLYGTTKPNGILYAWNDVDTWVQRAVGVGEIIYALCEFDGKLYGAGADTGTLYEWNDVDAWTTVAAALGTGIYDMCVFNEKLYGAGEDGCLYKWNESDAWTKRCDALADAGILGLCVFNNKLYGSTNGVEGGGAGAGLGKLYEFSEPGTSYDYQYFYTLVRNVGGHIDESGPSEVTDAAPVAEGQTATVTIPAWTGLGTDDYVTHWRLYRLSNATGAWQLVAEIAWGTGEYVDSVADEDLGNTCPSYYTSDQGNEIIWDLPLKNLEGITQEPISGLIFGWMGGRLYWNEPGYPDAWIDFYSMNFPAAIKNCVPFGEALGVLTATGPFRVSGDNPETLQQSPPLGNEPAMSVLGCCKSDRGILYLSDSGVVLFNLSDTTVITDEGFGEEWFKANISPAGAVMIEVDNVGYLFHSEGGLVYDARSDPPIASTLSEIIYAAYRKEDDDELYVMDGNGIQQFGAATAGTKAMTWKSGELLGDHPEEKSFIETELMSDSAVSLAVTNYIDGTSSATATLAMTTNRDKKLGFLDTKCIGRAAQFQIYKAAHDTLTSAECEVTEVIVRYTR